MSLRKRNSKRRWIARFHQGRLIPWAMIVEHDLLTRLAADAVADVPPRYAMSCYFPNIDAIRKNPRVPPGV